MKSGGRDSSGQRPLNEAASLMKNEVGDTSPNEVALSVLIEGDTFALVPLRSIRRDEHCSSEMKNIAIL